jgi:RNA polymerase sigma-70 factor (ECF subfamily)
VIPETDSDLIERWRAGDPAAFEALVLRWQRPVARFLTHFAGASGLVEDLCQEVFLRVYLARQRYRAGGAFSTWLYRIALNVARDAARRRKHRPSEPLGQHEPSGPGEEAVSLCAQEEVGRVVARALTELPEALRVVVVLRHYEKMSFEAMARLLKTPASTLKSRLTAALTRLRQRLSELGCGPEEIDA